MISRSALQKGWHFLDRGFLGLRARSYVQIEWVLTLIGGSVSGHWKGQKAPLRASQAKECTGCDSWVLGDPTGPIRFMARAAQWRKINHLLLVPTGSAKKLKDWPCAKSPACQQRSQDQIFAQQFLHSPAHCPGLQDGWGVGF